MRYYLKSRYGIEVDNEKIQKLIFQDLAGGSSDADCIDICELVAILLIPFFVKNAEGNSEKILKQRDGIQRAFASEKQMHEYLSEIGRVNSLVSKGHVIRHVLNIILADCTGSSEPQPITKDLIKTIFTRYGEPGLIQDEDLMDEMVLDVSGGDPNALLDADGFARALTEDVMLYNVDHESRVSTFYEDVFGREGEKEDSEDSENKGSGNETEPLRNDLSKGEDPELNVAEKQETLFRSIFTMSQVDFLADSCQSKIHLTLVYLTFIFAIFVFSNNNPIPACTPVESYGCAIANSIVYWLLIVGVTM